MDFSNILTCVFLILFSKFEFSIEKLRGINPSYLQQYDSSLSAVFQCFDNSRQIPFERVNDDYCDCHDGSDEPGTAACTNGYFYCTNEGFRPSVIPSSRVGDSICDCCDGSDEYQGYVNCHNNCLVLGEQFRAEEYRQEQLLKEGYQIYLKYSNEGTQAKEDKKIQLRELENEKMNLDGKLTELERIKNDIEAPEKDAIEKHKLAWEELKAQNKAEEKKIAAFTAFQKLDSNQDGWVDVEEMKSHLEFDIDSNGEVSNEEAKEYLEDYKVDSELFSVKVWEHIEQIYKKPISIEELKIIQESEKLEEKEKEGRAEEENTENELTEQVVDDQADEERNYGNNEEADDDDDDNEDNKKNDASQMEGSVENKTEEMPSYDEHIQHLIKLADEARNEYNEVKGKIEKIDRGINDAKVLIETDFGPRNEYLPLKEKCFEFTDREYIYTICPFSRTNQRSKNGGSETSLGNWGKWKEHKGNEYGSMLYEGGQNCWNGPDRSTQVLLECGSEDKLIAASEPMRCEYTFQFTTPAACSGFLENPEMNTPHSEL